MKLSNAAPGAALTIIAMLAVAGCRDAAVTQALAVADDPPEVIEFTLPLLDGSEVSLSDWRGQWVVVNYWATWCAPCRKEIPDFSQMHDARDDITVLGLAFEDTDIETFEQFLTEYPASYPILLVDVYAPPEALGAPMALPTTFLVSPEGELAETWIGPITSEQITARVDSEESMKHLIRP